MVRAIIIKVFDKRGELVQVKEIDTDIFNMYLERRRDLGTNYFGRFLAALFEFTGYQKDRDITVVDESGATKTVRIKTASDVPFFNSTYTRGIGAAIAVGSGTTAPTRSDNALESKIEHRVAGVKWEDNSDYISIYASFSFDSEVTISEVALFYETIDVNKALTRIYFDRTVLDEPISITPPGSVTVEYRIAI